MLTMNQMLGVSNSRVEALSPEVGSFGGTWIFFLYLDFYEVMKMVSHSGIVCMLSLSVQFFVTLCTVACQAPPSMGFSR